MRSSTRSICHVESLLYRIGIGCSNINGGGIRAVWISARVNTQFRRQVHIQHFITLIARTAGPFTKFRGKGFRPVALILARVDRRPRYMRARTYVEAGLLVYTACNFTPANTHAFCILPVTRRARPVKYGRDCYSYVTRMCGVPRGESYQLPCLRIAHNTSSRDRHKILCFTQLRCRILPFDLCDEVRSEGETISSARLPHWIRDSVLTHRTTRFVVMLIYRIFSKEKVYYWGFFSRSIYAIAVGGNPSY